MKNYLKSIFFKLSYNQTLRKISGSFFTYCPGLKMKLKELRDGSYVHVKSVEQKYSSDFLMAIKNEIEAMREGK